MRERVDHGQRCLSSPLLGVRLVCEDSGGSVLPLASEHPSGDDGLSRSRPQCKHGLFVADLKHHWHHLCPRVDQSEVTSPICGGYQEEHLSPCVCLRNWKNKPSTAILGSIKLLGFHPIPATSVLLHVSSASLKDPASAIEARWVFCFIIHLVLWQNYTSSNPAFFG